MVFKRNQFDMLEFDLARENSSVKQTAAYSLGTRVSEVEDRGGEIVNLE